MRPLEAVVVLLAGPAAGAAARARVAMMSSTVPSPATASAAALADRVSVGTLSVSALGVGALNWPLDKSEDARTADALRACVAGGVNLVDTAEAYGFGKSEELVRASLQTLAPGAEPVVVATKFAPAPWRMTAGSLVDACKASRARLGVERIALYQIHFPDVIQPLSALGIVQRKDEVYWRGLADCYEQGLCANIGVSNYGPKLLARAKAYFDQRGVPLASNQINYSLLYRRQGSQETVDWCRDHGIAVLGYFPLANGLLAGKYSAARLPAGLKALEMRKYVEGGVVERGVTYPPGGAGPLIAEMARIGNARGASVAQVALNYCMTKGVVPIPGCRDARMAADNAAALGWRLDGGEVDALEAAAEALGFEYSGGGFGFDQV